MKKSLLQALAAFSILLLGGIGAYHLIASRPAPPMRQKERPALVVKVIKARAGNFTYTVETTGTVIAPRRTELAAEVAGRIIYVSPRLLPGALLSPGEILLRIDPTDFEAAVAQAEAELAEARRNLIELEEEARRSIKEWQTLHPRETPPPLVKKEPELAAARSRVEAALRALARARRDLERTVIKAPYQARVLEVKVEVGDYASPGRVLAVIYRPASLEIYAPVAEHFLTYLRIPGFNCSEKEEGSSADVIWDMGSRRIRYAAFVARFGAAAEENTRLIPLYLRLRSFSLKPPLLPGVFVRVRIAGKTFSNVFLLPKEALARRRGETWVWIVNPDHRLRRQPVKILWENEKQVAILEGLREGDLVVAERHPGLLPGILVRIR